MNVDRYSALWCVILVGGATMQIVDLPPIPRWLNNAIFSTSFVMIVVAANMLLILHFHHRSTISQPVVVFGLDVSSWLAHIVNSQYMILVVCAALAFIAGAVVFPTKVDELAEPTPASSGIEKPTIPPVGLERLSPLLRDHVDTPNTPPTRVYTPRTPKELMDIVIEKTTRDASRHVGTWIHVEGPVLDISEVRGLAFEITKPYIVVEVIAGSLLDNAFHQTVKLHVDAATWRPQVDKIGDWLVAVGTVRDIHKLSMSVINGEIISVSGSGEKKR